MTADLTAPLLACAALLLAAPGCGEDATARVFGENRFVYAVEYTKGTVIVPPEQLDKLVKVETTEVPGTDPATGAETTLPHHTFTFSDPALGEGMAPGAVLIVHGRYLTRIRSVLTEDGTLIVATEPAKLTDAIRNGTIEWDITPNLSGMKLVTPDGRALKADSTADGYEFKFDWLDRKYTVWMNPKGTAANGLPEIQMNVTVQKIDGDTGRVTATFGAKGTTRLPRQATKIGITDSTLTKFEAGGSSLRSELTFEYVAEMSFGGTQEISFPGLTLKIPVESLTGLPMPLPLFINLGIGFVTTVNMPEATAWANAKVKLILDSDTGFDYKGPGVEAHAKIHEYELGTSDWEIGNMGTVPSPLEVRFDLSCPRLALELAGSEVAWRAGVCSLRSRLVVPSLCKASLYQVRLDGGYSLSILGIPIAGNEGAITEVSRTESTPECD
jgi:hypothetical protein